MTLVKIFSFFKVKYLVKRSSVSLITFKSLNLHKHPYDFLSKIVAIH